MPSLQDRFRGALLGTLLGDALGAPWEGANADRITAILALYPTLPPDEQQSLRDVFGLLLSDDTRGARYTDDTQMTFALAETLITHGAMTLSNGGTRFEEALALQFANRFDPKRLYGPGAHCVLEELCAGALWDKPARDLFGGRGSFGNGAAMRVAPVGVFFHRADAITFASVARRSALPTHTHPQGIAGAVMQAAAVASVCRQSREDFDLVIVLEDVETVLGNHEEALPYRTACTKIRQLLPHPLTPTMVAETLGNDITAVASVPAALCAFLAHPFDFRAAVTFAIQIGGDTDTISAMCGAVSGAFLGASALPTEWLAGVENGLHGRDYARDLGDRLFDCWQKGNAGGSSA